MIGAFRKHTPSVAGTRYEAPLPDYTRQRRLHHVQKDVRVRFLRSVGPVDLGMWLFPLPFGQNRHHPVELCFEILHQLA